MAWGDWALLGSPIINSFIWSLLLKYTLDRHDHDHHRDDDHDDDDSDPHLPGITNDQSSLTAPL